MAAQEQTEKAASVERVLLKPKTLAREWDMSLSMVYKLIASGALKAHRIGRSARVTRETADQFLREAGVNE